jgi:hypothetical protein
MLDRDKIINAIPAIMAELCGGEDTLRMLALHHTEGASYRSLAADHCLAESVVRTRLARARVTLRRLNLMPPAWDQTAKPASV